MPKYPVSHDSAESPALLSTPELNRAVWDRAAARMLAKMLGEFAYEEVIQPVTRSAGSGTYTLVLDDGGSLIFTMRPRGLRQLAGRPRLDPRGDHGRDRGARPRRPGSERPGSERPGI